jgi:endonuclease YncB( thermonuclease family)
MFRKFLNALPLLIALSLIAYACNRTQSQSPSQSQSLPTCEIKPNSVYDGDTLRVFCDGQESKIRFSCIDSPEVRPKQEGGIEARDHLRELLNQAGNQVKVNATDTDRYGRTVAELWMDRGNGWELVQLQQVRDAYVWANAKYKEDCPSWDSIAAAEKEAKAARRGIWAGSPIAPWEFRSRNR